jgi:hypothetical protein
VPAAVVMLTVFALMLPWLPLIAYVSKAVVATDVPAGVPAVAVVPVPTAKPIFDARVVLRAVATADTFCE